MEKKQNDREADEVGFSVLFWSYWGGMIRLSFKLGFVGELGVNAFTM